MKQFFMLFIDRYFNRNLHFRVRLFNCLAFGGIAVSIISSITAAINGEPFLSVAMNFLGAPLSFFLMHYASRTGNYVRCYIITIIIVFFIIFPVIYFSGGGYKGAMPSFFILAMLFTVFMLDGKKAIIFSILELLLYILICIYSYIVPESYIDFVSPFAEFWDTVIGFTIASAALVFSLMFHFKLYNEQKLELEAAKFEAEKFSEAKSTFLANTSHEIRTPINVILGLNEMISFESNSEQISEYSMGIENAGKTLLTLISNILDMSKIEAGKLQSAEETYPVSTLIDELSGFGSKLTERKGLTFLAEVDDNLPVGLIGNYDYIKQVILNLLGNAAKYTEEGGVVLSVGFAAGESDDTINLLISVRDTGFGIKPDDLAVLFDTFTRVDPSVTGSIEGAGLGLSISKKLTQFMGGQISVESIYTEGSTFTVKLPQRIADKTPISLLTDRKKSVTHGKKGSFIAPEASVLAVDDNEDNLKILRLLLSRTMVKLDTAESCEKCLKAVAQKRYHVIIMDYMMPGQDGIETLNKLRETDGFNATVIVLTANASTEAEEKLKSAGFALYLSKPVVWKELENALMKAIPSELITPHITVTEKITQANRENLMSLKNFGISHADGLAFLSGDYGQYIKIVSLFIENNEDNKKTFSDLAEKNDFSQLLHETHSLKSKARAIGANDLSDTAGKLERLCDKKDEQHIKLLMPILFYEWDRATKGLSEFCINTQTLVTPVEDSEDISLTDLMPLIKRNRQLDALELIEKLLANDISPDIETILNEIREKINDVEFRDAEKLLTNLIGEGSDERQKIYSYS
jgi:signal transduction histidine kinase/FixJ family two-component response regulator/HPt (histidine-containing phosphotransfer) domain-containing protein